MWKLPLALKRPDLRIVERITRQQITQLILAHPTADAIAKQALLTYQPQSRWCLRGKPIHIWLFTGDVPDNHLYQVKNEHASERHEIIITLSRRVPAEYRNTFYLYCLGLALDNLFLHQGDKQIHIGSQLDPQASRISFDMIVLSEGQRAVSDLPWKRRAA